MSFDTSDFENAEQIEKNGREHIRVFRHKYMETPLISVRLFSPRGVPSYKGISLKPEHWKQVLPILEKLLNDAIDEGVPSS